LEVDDERPDMEQEGEECKDSVSESSSFVNENDDEPEQ